jgi:hypothetical protein
VWDRAEQVREARKAAKRTSRGQGTLYISLTVVANFRDEDAEDWVEAEGWVDTNGVVPKMGEVGLEGEEGRVAEGGGNSVRSAAGLDDELNENQMVVLEDFRARRKAKKNSKP